jgi:hypothetical protein
MLGTGTGMQMHFLVGSTLGALLFGTDRARLAVSSGDLGAAPIIALEMLVLHDWLAI